MSAHRVSPPTGGMIRPRRIDPVGGASRNVTSVCQRSAREGPSLAVSSTTISGWPSLGRKGWIFELAELSAEGDVVLDGDVLVAEEQHLPVEPGLMEVDEGLVVERDRSPAPATTSAPIVPVSGSTRIGPYVVVHRYRRSFVGRGRAVGGLLLGAERHQAEGLEDAGDVVVGFGVPRSGVRRTSP